jgi:ligand-binding SRPBCC domain-containing protein
MMTLPAALAHSSGNKARAYNDNLTLIIVQERYSSRSLRWIHVWRMGEDDSGTIVVNEMNLSMNKADMKYLHSVYGVDPIQGIWEAI